MLYITKYLPWEFDHTIPAPEWYVSHFKEPDPPAPRRGRPHKGGEAHNAFDRAKAYALKVPGARSGDRGHDHTFALACELYNGFGLNHDELLAVLADWNQSCDPPWNTGELEHKVTDAMAKVYDKPHGWRLTEGRAPARWQPGTKRPKAGPTDPDAPPTPGLPPPPEAAAGQPQPPAPPPLIRGQPHDPNDPDDLPVIANYEMVDDGSGKPHKDPKHVDQIELDRLAVRGDWPKRVGKRGAGVRLFFETAAHEVEFVENPHCLFAFLQAGRKVGDGDEAMTARVLWGEGEGFVPRAVYYEHVVHDQRAVVYEDIQYFPHWPPLPGVYYACNAIEPNGDGSALDGLVGFFRGLEPVDRTLIKSLVMTLF
jgi:hypothetical protein